MTAEQQKIYSACFLHRNGENARIFRSRESALEWRRQIADQWWVCEMKCEPPADRQVKADAYFNQMNHREYFTIHECTLED